MIRVDRLQCQWKADTFWSVWFPGASVAVANTYPVFIPIFRNSCPGSIRLWVKTEEKDLNSFKGSCFIREKEEREREERKGSTIRIRSYQSSHLIFKDFYNHARIMKNRHSFESAKKHDALQNVIVWRSLSILETGNKKLIKNVPMINLAMLG